MLTLLSLYQHRNFEERNEKPRKNGKCLDVHFISRFTLSPLSFLLSLFVKKQEAKELGTISIMLILLGFSNVVIPGKPGFMLTSTLH